MLTNKFTRRVTANSSVDGDLTAQIRIYPLASPDFSAPTVSAELKSPQPRKHHSGHKTFGSSLPLSNTRSDRSQSSWSFKLSSLLSPEHITPALKLKNQGDKFPVLESPEPGNCNPISDTHRYAPTNVPAAIAYSPFSFEWLKVFTAVAAWWWKEVS